MKIGKICSTAAAGIEFTSDRKVSCPPLARRYDIFLRPILATVQWLLCSAAIMCIVVFERAFHGELATVEPSATAHRSAFRPTITDCRMRIHFEEKQRSTQRRHHPRQIR